MYFVMVLSVAVGSKFCRGSFVFIKLIILYLFTIDPGVKEAMYTYEKVKGP